MPNWVPKSRPIGEWPTKLLEMHVAGKDLLFSFYKNFQHGYGWHTQAGGASISDRIKAEFKQVIKSSGSVNVGRIMSCETVDFQFIYLPVNRDREFLPFNQNVNGVSSPGRRHYMFPQRILKWSWMKGVDLAGEGHFTACHSRRLSFCCPAAVRAPTGWHRPCWQCRL